MIFLIESLQEKTLTQLSKKIHESTDIRKQIFNPKRMSTGEVTEMEEVGNKNEVFRRWILLMNRCA